MNLLNSVPHVFSCSTCLVPHVPRTLCALVAHVPYVFSSPTCFVPSALLCFAPYALSCPTCLVLHMASCTACISYSSCSRALPASFPTCSRVSCFSYLACSCASHASCPMCSRAPVPPVSCASCPTCSHALWALFMSPYGALRILVPRTLSTLCANIAFYVLEFPCLTLLIFRSLHNCDFFGIYTS